MDLCLEFAFKVKLSEQEDMQELVARLFLRILAQFSSLILMELLKDGISLNKGLSLKMWPVIPSLSKMCTHFA